MSSYVSLRGNLYLVNAIYKIWILPQPPNLFSLSSILLVKFQGTNAYRHQIGQLSNVAAVAASFTR